MGLMMNCAIDGKESNHPLFVYSNATINLSPLLPMTKGFIHLQKSLGQTSESGFTVAYSSHLLEIYSLSDLLQAASDARHGHFPTSGSNSIF